jgi:hypothetical protein
LLQYLARQQRLHIFIRETRTASLGEDGVLHAEHAADGTSAADATADATADAAGTRITTVALKAQRPQRGFQQWLVLASRSRADCT